MSEKMEKADELLKRIHEGQSVVTGDDLGAFVTLQNLGYVFWGKDSTPDRYVDVLPTISGTRRVIDPLNEIGR
jgi:hypothetical protein